MDILIWRDEWLTEMLTNWQIMIIILSKMMEPNGNNMSWVKGRTTGRKFQISIWRLGKSGRNSLTAKWTNWLVILSETIEMSQLRSNYGNSTKNQSNFRLFIDSLSRFSHCFTHDLSSQFGLEFQSQKINFSLLSTVFFVIPFEFSAQNEADN